MNMSDDTTKYNYLVEFDFSDLDTIENINDIDDLKHELIEDMGVVLSRLFDKYDSLVGFRQTFELAEEVKE